MFTGGWGLSLVLLACQPPLCSVRPQVFFSSLTGRQHLLWDFSLSTFSLPQLQFLCLFKKIPLFPLLLIFSLCSKFSVISSSWLGGFRLEGRDRKARVPLSGLGSLKHLEINQTPQIRSLNSCFPSSCTSFCNLGFIATSLFCSLSCLLTHLGVQKLIRNALRTAQLPS